MKTITLTADEALIEAAEKRAAEQHTTLDEEFRRWLAEYSGRAERIRQFEETVAALEGKLRVGRKLTREEMNER